MNRRAALYTVFVLLVVSLSLLVALLTVFKAPGGLAQVYTSPDGKLTMSYPEGWFTVEQPDGIAFTTSVELLTPGAQISSGQATLLLTFTDLDATVTTPAAALRQFGAVGFPEERVIAGYPAALARNSGQATGIDVEIVMVAIMNVDDGVMGVAIGAAAPGELATFEPTFLAMLETIRYG
jgi:hypothetical protein